MNAEELMAIVEDDMRAFASPPGDATAGESDVKLGPPASDVEVAAMLARFNTPIGAAFPSLVSDVLVGLPSLFARIAADAREREELKAERDKLAAFKAYVHKRLDDAGVPTDPDSAHKAEGCRIGGRLDIVLHETTPAAPGPRRTND